jgi:hypothetical protein
MRLTIRTNNTVSLYGLDCQKAKAGFPAGPRYNVDYLSNGRHYGFSFSESNIMAVTLIRAIKVMLYWAPCGFFHFLTAVFAGVGIPKYIILAVLTQTT